MMLTACESPSSYWAVRVVLHREYDPISGTGDPRSVGLAEPSGLPELGPRALFCPIPVVWERNDPRNELYTPRNAPDPSAMLSHVQSMFLSLQKEEFFPGG